VGGHRRPAWSAVALAALAAASCRAARWGPPQPLFELEHPEAQGVDGNLLRLVVDEDALRPGDRVSIPRPGREPLLGVVTGVDRTVRLRAGIAGRLDDGGTFWIADRWGDISGFVRDDVDESFLRPVCPGLASKWPRRYAPARRCDVRRPGTRPASEPIPASAAASAAGDADADADTACGPPPPCTWSETTAPPETESTLRILYVFTKDAIEGMEATEIGAYVGSSVRTLRDALKRSGIDRPVESPGAFQVEEPGSGDAVTDLARLECWRDGHWDEIHSWRDQVHADVVALVVKGAGPSCDGFAEEFRNSDLPGGSAGFAQRGFLVVDADSFRNHLTVAHEVGHLLGCGHNRDSEKYEECDRVLPGAHGFVFVTARESEGGFSTIMQARVTGQSPYAWYPVVPRYSNPRLCDSMGHATGRVADDGDPLSGCDNVSAIELTWNTIASLRHDDGDEDPYAVGCPIDCRKHDPPAFVALPADLTTR
jgi:hypothetical protein